MPEAPFDQVTREYELGRAGYPDGVFDAIEAVAGPLAGQLVIEGGAGTGIATRQLAARGPRIVAFDLSRSMLARARRPDEPPFVVADGDALPFRRGAADVVCFGQAWHWLDPGRASAEVAAVLRAGGTWAAWWSFPRADGEPWFDAARAVIVEVCPTHYWRGRDEDWGETLRAGDRFTRPVLTAVPWVREVTVEAWLTELRSHSAVAALAAAERESLVARLRALLREHAGDGPVAVRSETRLWTARRTQAT